ncbi:MAG: glycosyltransferase family 4 protein [Bacteroidia bacterium]|nr:glycosyltransferase family 4 protein [Bacteroidia bacterium]
MKPMHVAFFTDGIYPYVMGGMQTHSYNLIKQLAMQKVQVTVYHVLPKAQEPVDYNIHFTPNELHYITFNTFVFPTGKRFVGHYLYYSYQYSKLITQHFVAHNTTATVVFAKGFSAWYLLANKKKLGVTIPILVKFHGLEMWQRAASFTEKLKQYLLRPAVGYNLRNATAVVSYGGNITKIIQAQGVPLSNIIDIPTGIAQSWLSERRTQVNTVRKFVFVGRYERRKGLEELNQAIAQLQHDALLNCEFHFIGPIPQPLRLAHSNCIYCGSITDANELKKIIITTDILICPSYAEGMPNVILEAMASGNAIISTNVGAINTMVNNTNGWLMSTCNVSEIAITIKKAIATSDVELLQKQNNSIAITRSKFMWNTLVHRYIKAFEKK